MCMTAKELHTFGGNIYSTTFCYQALLHLIIPFIQDYKNDFYMTLENKKRHIFDANDKDFFPNYFGSPGTYEYYAYTPSSRGT